MRIRVKVALVDVRSGNWAVFSPEAFDDSRASTSLRRGAKDQQQVELLKAKACGGECEGIGETVFGDIWRGEMSS